MKAPYGIPGHLEDGKRQNRLRAVPGSRPAKRDGPSLQAVRNAGPDFRWARYWEAKQRYLDEHPEATAEEVGRAFREIAKDLKL